MQILIHGFCKNWKINMQLFNNNNYQFTAIIQVNLH